MRALVTWAVLVVVVAGTVCHVVGDASTATTTSGAASQAASSKSHQRMHSTGAPVAGNTRTPAEYDPMVHENIEPIDFLPLGGPLRRQCQMHLELAWETEVESAAYSAPLMSPIQSTDMKQILIATYDESIELLSHDGHNVAGWPVSFAGANFFSSPVLYDIDGDGMDDVAVADSHGRILFLDLDAGGEYVGDFVLTIPRLALKHDWADGLTGEGVEASMLLSSFESTVGRHEHGATSEKLSPRLQRLDEDFGVFSESFRQGSVSDGFGPAASAASAASSGDGGVEEPESIGDLDIGDDDLVVGETALGVEDDDFFTAFGSVDGLRKEINSVGDYVLVDAHLLSAPVIVDINGDGGMEMLVAVSFMFDDEQVDFDNAYAPGLNNTHIDPSNYLATGVVCYDLQGQQWLWQVHLDVSTTTSTHPSRATSSPSVADLDGDGEKEVVVATMAGYVYVLSAEGRVKKGFPFEMDGSVDAQVILEDLAGTSDLELLATDDEGNVVVIDVNGKQVWRKVIHEASPAAPSVGDVDGDGKLDIVVTSRDGGVWVLEAATGDVFDMFPMRLPGKIVAPTTLLALPWLDRSSSTATGLDLKSQVLPGVGDNQGLHIVVPCLDGNLYVLSGSTGCVRSVALHAHVYAPVMATDLSHDGRLELIVATMSGHVIAVSTAAPFHPLNAQPRLALGGAVSAHRLGYHGIFFVANHHRSVAGPTLSLQYEIVDNRHRQHHVAAVYNITIRHGRMILYQATKDGPGVHVATITLTRPQVTSLTIVMENEHGQVFSDVATVSFNNEFYHVLKWLVVLPVVLGTFLVLTLKPRGVPLPA